jgi:hypothetical protein
VKWKGFSEDECTWEPLSNLDACSKMISKYEKEQAMGEEKESKPANKSPKPDKKKAAAAKMRDESEAQSPRPEKEKEKKKSSMDEEKPGRYDVLKRTTIDNETVFKVLDLTSKKEQFISRKELLKEDPVALCLFYEKHIVS